MDLAAAVASAYALNKRKKALPAQGSIPPFSIVEILWLDAQSYAVDWETLLTVKGHTMARTLSAGYLIEDAPEHYSIAMILNTEAIGSGLIIPKGCVQDVRWIK